MKKSNLIVISVFLVLLAQGCIPGGGVTPDPATQVPPTPVLVTPEPATATLPPPTVQPPATATQLPASPTPAPADTTVPLPPTEPVVTATPAQPEAILIQQPGPGSRVAGPVRVSGMADPTFEQSLVVTILTADGTALATVPTQIGADVGQRGPFAVDVPFNVSAEQQGYIQVYAISARDGGVTHLSSVGVTLLPPGGAAAIQPVTEQPEQVIIQQPAVGMTISGGTVRVAGFGLASFEQTLLVELLDESGQVIASAPIIVAAPDLGQPGPFNADLSYSVSTGQAGRVQVRDVSPAHGGNSHLSSVEVRLEP